MQDRNSTAPTADMNSKHWSKLPDDRSASTPGQTTASRSADRLHVTNYTNPGFANREKGLYAIIDTITNTIVGGIQLHMNTASAIRTLADIATADTNVNKHPLDFQLRLLGTITEDHHISPELGDIILVGEQIAAIIANAKQEGR